MPFDPPLDFGIDLDSIAARLADLGYFNGVEGIERASTAFDEIDYLPPYAFVSNAAESAERMKRIGAGEAYQVTVDFSVLFCIPAERRDEKAVEVVEKARRAVMRQLLQWTPDGAECPLRYRRWLVKSVGGGLIWGEVIMWATYRLVV